MESASNPSELSLPKNLRPKQQEIIEAFKTAIDLTVKLPTGYGKTLAAAGAYAMLRHRGVCNRVLYVVPRSGQARQAAEAIPEELNRFGIKTRSIEIYNGPQAIRASRENKVEVFITTIQGLISPAGWNTATSLMEVGRWFIVIDEHHHYSINGVWSEKVNSLPSCARLAMSATPQRADKADYFPCPTVIETYLGARKQDIVKTMSLHAYEYRIDAVMVDGSVVPYTSEQLVVEVGSKEPEAIDAWLVAKKMRWSPKYISPLITFPADRLITLRTKGLYTQMLVQVMSCSHAQMVCEQVRALLPEHIEVDWVGTGPNGKSQNENEAILERFCPKKDAQGVRQWDLDVLVNVGMAGEGLDTTDVSEVVFLSPANFNITTLQTIGRGARVIPGISKEKQPVCHVNVDTGSPIAPFVGEKVMELFDDAVLPEVLPPKEEDGTTPEWLNEEFDEPLPEKITVMILDVQLIDIRSEPLWEVVMDSLRSDFPNVPSEDALVEAAEIAIRRHLNRGNNISSNLAQKKDAVEDAVASIASTMVKRVVRATNRFEKSMAGDYRRRINSEKKRLFGSVTTADEAQLDKHYAWLVEVNRQIILDHGFKGVPQWLR